MKNQSHTSANGFYVLTLGLQLSIEALAIMFQVVVREGYDDNIWVWYKIKKDEMGKACSKYEVHKKCMQ
jgi:hypothetical protein